MNIRLVPEAGTECLPSIRNLDLIVGYITSISVLYVMYNIIMLNYLRLKDGLTSNPTGRTKSKPLCNLQRMETQIS